MDGSNKVRTKEDCVGLERASLWQADQMEERLQDHFTGKKNDWQEQTQKPETYRRNSKVYPERVKELLKGLE